MDILTFNTADLQLPDYRIHKYTDNIYKIVKFKNTSPRLVRVDREKFEKYDKKLDASLSRSRRVVLELALCNKWKYFCTFTIAEKNYDRKNLALFHKNFSQFIRDQRKKHNIDIQYLLVPEQHKDGSWHMHGLFSDITPLLTSFYWLDKNGYNVPYDLVDEGYYCWVDYWLKFGFCSLGLISDLVACGFYISKYISKSMATDCLSVGLHLYYPSRGLARSSVHGEIYGYVSELEKFLVNDYDFVRTGMTHVNDNLSWHFGLEYMDYDLLEAFKLPELSDQYSSADTFAECEQLVFSM